MADARIRVRRDRGGYRDRFGSYRVVLDGAVVGSVKREQSITVMTDAGHHDLHLKIDWARSKSVELDLEPDGEVEVRCWPNGNPLMALYSITFERSRYIGIEVSEDTTVPDAAS